MEENLKSKGLIIDYYTINDLNANRDILIEIPNKKLDNIRYAGKQARIIFKMDRDAKHAESDYYKILKELFNKLKNEDHSYNIEIRIKNRVLFNESNILNELPNNINLRIDNHRYSYTIEEYKKEEEKIDKILEPIKNSNLSPFEKYLAVYNIVKKFKKYNDCTCDTIEDCDRSRIPKYILEDDNEYIVCEGFAKLLKEFLNKVGISSKETIIILDLSRDEGYDESKYSSTSAHDRVLVYINDDKYNIHGYYLSDPTFDSITDYDLYINSLTTFDRKKEARRLELLGKYDLLLDFHNFDEFQTKINHYLRRKIIEDRYYTERENVQIAYMQLFADILNILEEVDYNEYSILYNKYYKYIMDYCFNFEMLEKVASEMLTEYANYILPLTNNNIPFETIINAAKVVKQKIDHYDEKELQDWLDETVYANEEVSNFTIPYLYDPNNKTEAYLKDHPKSKIKRP